MNTKQRTKVLLNDLGIIQSEITKTKEHMARLEKQEREIGEELKELQSPEVPMISAANLWCRITNALIAKYKPMAEQNPEKAFNELLMIQGALLAGEFLTKEELEKAL